ncbi:hypothetical protein E2C01_041389 [Portunus trituberculatus]|uniref:Uncharacterized protein n=1 Tax=Portunus trituberculatus TaxID=210409 RepID=A0A5B7FRS7_PORTR|nr:hypothetical protein [Portunus trituberculatus]
MVITRANQPSFHRPVSQPVTRRTNRRPKTSTDPRPATEEASHPSRAGKINKSPYQKQSVRQSVSQLAHHPSMGAGSSTLGDGEGRWRKSARLAVLKFITVIKVSLGKLTGRQPE